VSAEFHLFGPLHLAILVANLAVPAGLAFVTRRYWSCAAATRIALASILAADGLSWHLYRYFAQGVGFPDILPLEMCDIAFWLTVIALLTLEEHIFELAYYWGLAGSGMATITPYLRTPLHTYQSCQYFTGHCLLIIGVLYLLWSGQARPRARSWWFALCSLNLYAAMIAVVDWLGGTNFMYLREKPASMSLLDMLGRWPWYIVASEFVALILFLLLQQPFRSPEFGKPGTA
jgi:hypothetical integral membrane protein (TIGR02206 family)